MGIFLFYVTLIFCATFIFRQAVIVSEIFFNKEINSFDTQMQVLPEFQIYCFKGAIYLAKYL